MFIFQWPGRFSTLWLLLISSSFFLLGCSPSDPPPIESYKELGELRVATRPDALSYLIDEEGNTSGFEHDLLIELGHQLNVPVRFMVYPDLPNALMAVLQGQAHLAAAGLSKNERLPLEWTQPFSKVKFVLVRRLDSPEVPSQQSLEGRTITVRRGTLSAEALHRMKENAPSLRIRLITGSDDLTLLDQLAEGELDLVATNDMHYTLASRIHPSLSIAYTLPVEGHIAWALPLNTDQELSNQIQRFLITAQHNNLLSRTADRYFGHVDRLDENDITVFFSRINERLPSLRLYFFDAQMQTGIDWRFLAALAYQESHWDPFATSRTGVRGLMMLTEDTADRLGVTNRLDARQSILGGARYIAMIKNSLPDNIPEPDRLWMATAAYNLGMGHMNGARSIAATMGKDNTSWWDMKAILPLLSRPEYAKRLKAGSARGGEAVIMTENIRNYYDILSQIEAPYSPALADAHPRLGIYPSSPGSRIPKEKN